MELNSAIYKSLVVHDRKKPKPNFFRYPIFMFLIDLDELFLLQKKFWLIGYNRPNIFSFYDRDHFKQTKKEDINSTRQKLENYLLSKGFDERPEKILLLTNLRIMGHVFNPVSFYYCYDDKGKVFCVVAEVSNTYGEMKMYLVKESLQGKFNAIHPKEFYISPFTELDDYLDLKVGIPNEKLKILIDDFSGDQVKVKTILTGVRRTLTNMQLLKYFIRFPLLTVQIISLIHWQALKLWLKGVKYIPKDDNLHLQKDIYYTNTEAKNDSILLQKNSPEAIAQNEIG